MKEVLANTQDLVATLLEMLTSVGEEEALTTRSKKNYVLQKLGKLTNGKIGQDPNNPSIVVEPFGNSPGPCVVCGEEITGMIKAEVSAKYTTAFKE